MDRMLRGMTVRQFMEWRAYADLEPFDEVRTDIRFAELSRVLLEIAHRGKKRFKLSDCVLHFGGDDDAPKRTSREAARDQIMGVMSQMGATTKGDR